VWLDPEPSTDETLNPRAYTRSTTGGRRACWRFWSEWAVYTRLPGKGNPNSHGARPVHQIISMIKWIRTSRLSIKNSLSVPDLLRVDEGDAGVSGANGREGHSPDVEPLTLKSRTLHPEPPSPEPSTINHKHCALIPILTPPS